MSKNCTAPAKRKTLQPKTSRTPFADLAPTDATLLERLRQWRADTTYVILHDKTMR